MRLADGVVELLQDPARVEHPLLVLVRRARLVERESDRTFHQHLHVVLRVDQDRALVRAGSGVAGGAARCATAAAPRVEVERDSRRPPLLFVPIAISGSASRSMSASRSVRCFWSPSQAWWDMNGIASTMTLASTGENARFTRPTTVSIRRRNAAAARSFSVGSHATPAGTMGCGCAFTRGPGTASGWPS